MEPALKWAGNPNVTVAVKAYGLKATVQVVDLQVFASPRITLKPLVPSIPCFANIFVSLMEKPHVDFGLKLLGADLMSIPGAYRFVQNPELKLDTTEDSEKSANSEKSAEVSYEDDNDVNTD
ncbi:hypothetical protein POM88_044801 [Heracleum sosnowskyi]|uniref:Uncharacterized protein n=1 Tax=Heracleum sosnowskyi TaxID=360622 RepID=A0AAD8H676_9APIA|nr:hypothetical protein POM88_044801 [Heracleum sosnowskyi]